MTTLCKVILFKYSSTKDHALVISLWLEKSFQVSEKIKIARQTNAQCSRVSPQCVHQYLEKGTVIGDHTAVAGFYEAVAHCRLMTKGTLTRCEHHWLSVGGKQGYYMVREMPLFYTV